MAPPLHLKPSYAVEKYEKYEHRRQGTAELCQSFLQAMAKSGAATSYSSCLRCSQNRQQLSGHVKKYYLYYNQEERLHLSEEWTSSAPTVTWQHVQQRV